MIGRHRIGLLGASLLALGVLPVGHGKASSLEVNGRRGPGIQLRDERERVGEPLRILAAYTGLTAVQIGEFERGVAVPTPEQWAALRECLPDLGEMEAPPSEAERSPVLTAGDLRRQGATLPDDIADDQCVVLGIDHALHPAGRCTCAQEGTCSWCVMDRARAPKPAKEPNDRSAKRPEQAKARRGRSSKKARRGW